MAAGPPRAGTWAESSHLRTPGLSHDKAPLRWHGRWGHRRFLLILPSSGWTPDQWGNTLGEALHFSDPACLHCPTRAQKGLQRRETPAASVGRTRLQGYRGKFQIWRASPRSAARASSAPARPAPCPEALVLRERVTARRRPALWLSATAGGAGAAAAVRSFLRLPAAAFPWRTGQTSPSMCAAASRAKRGTFSSTRPPLPAPPMV